MKLGPLHIYLSAAFFFGVSALMGVYSALLGGNPSDSSWHLSTALAGVIATITGIFLQRNARICLQGLIACWWILLALATYVDFAQQLLANQQIVRVELWLTNPNLLAAALTMSGIVLLAFMGKRQLAALTIPFTLGALVLTGSRIGVMAYTLSVLLFLLINPAFRRSSLYRSCIGLSALLGLILFVWLLLPSPTTELRRNLLWSSNVITQASWSIHHALTATPINLTTDESPDGKLQSAYRITPQDPESGLPKGQLLRQGLNVPAENVPIIASAYLRSDAPSTIMIRTNLTSVRCDVNDDWQRCVTPVGYGNGIVRVHFFMDLVDGELAYLDIAGAQVESSTLVTEAQITSPFIAKAQRQEGFLRRGLVTANWIDAFSSRLKALSSGWHLFLASPISGIGIENFSAALTLQDEGNNFDDIAAHAHNVFIHILATTGIVGFISWLIPMLGIHALSWKPESARMLPPMYLAALLLNLADYTYHNAGVYYLFWILLGAMTIHADDRRPS